MVRNFSPLPIALLSCLGLTGLGCLPGGSSSDGSGGSNGSGGSSNSGSGGHASGGSSGSSSGGSNGSSSGGSNGSGSGGHASGGSNSSSSGGASSGGSTGSGGASTGSGGHASGGSTASGSGGAGTSTGGSMGSGSGGSTVSGDCTFTQMATMSTKIATVATLTWSTSTSNLTAAHVDFGLTTSYGMTAPVPMPAASNTTLLLGMKASKMYHYRITATSSSGDCQSPDYTLMTGALANGLPKITLSPATAMATGLAGGFLITGQYAQGAAGSPAYIIDADGDIVWWYNIGSDVTGAVMSYDGTHMWINGANVPSGTVHVHRVTMDGVTDEDLSSKFAGQNHQLTVLPDETVAFYGYSTNGCDDIKEYSPATGMTKTIVNAMTAHGGTGMCHVNNVQYLKDDDTYVFSDLDNVCVTKIDRTGKTIWVANGINGIKSTFTGDTWAGGQHGINVLAADDFIIFNNNTKMSVTGGASGGTGDGSIAIEIKLDLTAKTMTKKWSYKASPGIQNDIMGDVQRMPNGNTIVAYSTKGVLDEVDSTGKMVLQEISWPLGAEFGFIEKRPTLYGPPPR